jgi:hypothetical protein
MQLDDAVYKTLVEVCDAYPWNVVQEDYHIGEILNAVAYAHRDKGYGLSRKTGGKHIDSPVGPIAEDILQLPDGNHFDVLGGIDVGQPLRPGRASSIGIINLRDRPWVKPISHPIEWLGGHVQPDEPDKEPDKEPDPVPNEPCKFTPCSFPETVSKAEFEAFKQRVEVLFAHIDKNQAQMIEQLGRVEAKPSGGNCRLRW